MSNSGLCLAALLPLSKSSSTEHDFAWLLEHHAGVGELRFLRRLNTTWPPCRLPWRASRRLVSQRPELSLWTESETKGGALAIAVGRDCEPCPLDWLRGISQVSDFTCDWWFITQRVRYTMVTVLLDISLVSSN